LEWVEWSNNRRVPQPTGSIPPVEAEVTFYEILEGSDIIASLSQISLRRLRRSSAEVFPLFRPAAETSTPPDRKTATYYHRKTPSLLQIRNEFSETTVEGKQGVPNHRLHFKTLAMSAKQLER